MSTSTVAQEPAEPTVTLETVYAAVQGLAAHVELAKVNRERIETLEDRVEQVETRLSAVESNQSATAKTAKTLADAALKLQMARILGSVAPTALRFALILGASFAGGLAGQALVTALQHR